MKLYEKIKPTIILTFICMAVAALIAFFYNLTYQDLTGVMTDEMKSGAEDIFGDNEYTFIYNNDGEDDKYNNIISIIKAGESDNLLFEIVYDGYEKEGLHILVGVDENGEVAGVSILSIKETKGLGDKVAKKSFREKFIGAKSSDEVQNIDTISGATYSSKGMKDAVAEVLSIYNDDKEVLLGEVESE